MLDRRFMIWVVACVVIGTVACSSQEPRVRSLGPEVRADLVIFFNRNMTHQQIEDFWLHTLSKPDVQGRGHPQRDGVSQTARIEAVQGHEGISVSFFPNASQAQRDSVENDLRSSPLVYKVLKDIAPADVKKIE